MAFLRSLLPVNEGEIDPVTTHLDMGRFQV